MLEKLKTIKELREKNYSEKLNEISEKLLRISKAATENLENVVELKKVEELRIELLGKKSELMQILKGMGSLSKEERPSAGQMANEVRELIEEKIEIVKKELSSKGLEMKLKSEKIDVTMPGEAVVQGKKHPLTTVMDELKQIFIGMGFEIAEGPDVETDYYNFEALNIPKDHPAKDEQDTFYVEGGFVLRTQTSPMQVRTMEKSNLPIRTIAPGTVFRSDEVDATHSPVFHQLEGLVVDKNINMGHLKGTLSIFAKEVFGEDTKVRFRPHHFPFTEPSAEMDVTCFSCGGSGCRICKNSGFIEILGCGMVHPKVLEMSGIDPKVYKGFAFGMGIERIVMQRYGISDLRLLYENDVRFLKQF